MSSSSSKRSVRAILRSLAAHKNRFDAVSIGAKEQDLYDLQRAAAWTAKEALEAHDLLLFCLAHPHSADFHRKAEKTLQHLVSMIRRKKLYTSAVLAESGLPNTRVHAVFTLEMVEWLMEEVPGHISFDSLGASEETAEAIISSLLPAIERDYFLYREEATVTDYLVQASGKQDVLHTLLRWLRESGQAHTEQAATFARLEVFVQLDLTHDGLSRTMQRGPSTPLYLHTDLVRKVDPQVIMLDPIEHSDRMSDADVEALISVKRRALLPLYRETDPGTYADPRDVVRFDMGRGLRIALYGMDPAHRLPLESYIGFMAFKNDIPYAYGGAWMLGDTAKIGINVFAPFRGGESAWFFCQLMRLYYQLYRPAVFIAEPYQIGKDNPEGLQSGAFWFYYRLGFRPTEGPLAKLAAFEFGKMAKDASYRSPVKVLEQLASSNMELPIGAESKRAVVRIDPWTVGRTITLRRAAKKSSAWSTVYASDETPRWSSSMLALMAVLPIHRWKAEDQQAFYAFAVEKSEGLDSTAAQLLRQNVSLKKALAALDA